jgi:hypothetical protein
VSFICRLCDQVFDSAAVAGMIPAGGASSHGTQLYFTSDRRRIHELVSEHYRKTEAVDAAPETADVAEPVNEEILS